MHQASDLIAVVLDPELVTDQFGNAGGGPEIGSVAMHHWPLQQKVDQAPSLEPTAFTLWGRIGSES